MKKVHLNSTIHVKLNDLGADIYYHRLDGLIEKGVQLERRLPQVDADGYSRFQLWAFMRIYGSHFALGAPEVLDDLHIYLADDDVEEVIE